MLLFRHDLLLSRSASSCPGFFVRLVVLLVLLTGPTCAIRVLAPRTGRLSAAAPASVLDEETILLGEHFGDHLETTGWLDDGEDAGPLLSTARFVRSEHRSTAREQTGADLFLEKDFVSADGEVLEVAAREASGTS